MWRTHTLSSGRVTRRVQLLLSGMCGQFGDVRGGQRNGLLLGPAACKQRYQLYATVATTAVVVVAIAGQALIACLARRMRRFRPMLVRRSIRADIVLVAKEQATIATAFRAAALHGRQK